MAPRRGRKRYGKKKKPTSQSKYRGTVARVPRAIPMKPRSVCQKLVYYQSFHCVPGLDLNSNQQNYFFTICLNSPWLFPSGWDAHATTNNRYLNANSPIYPLDAATLQPNAQTTSMPGLKEGFSLFNQYQNGLVLGCKVTLSAQPTGRTDTGQNEQSGVFYAIRHAKQSGGLTDLSTITEVQKAPFRQIRRIAGPAGGTGQSLSYYERNTGAKIIVTHSPKKFNDVQSLKDNDRFQFHQQSTTDPYGLTPEDSDFLTVGVVPSLKGYQGAHGIEQRKAPDFKLSMRVEQTILFTEPLENLVEGTGNYSLPWAARFGREFMRQTFLR